MDFLDSKVLQDQRRFLSSMCRRLLKGSISFKQSHFRKQNVNLMLRLTIAMNRGLTAEKPIIRVEDEVEVSRELIAEVVGVEVDRGEISIGPNGTTLTDLTTIIHLNARSIAAKQIFHRLALAI